MDGDEQRGAILQALREGTDGLVTAQLAAQVGLHPNTVRWHLSRLQESGLVCSAPEKSRRRGRPAIVYRLTADGIVAGRDEYRLLAMMLTDTLAGDPGAPARVYESGVRWGRHLHEANPEKPVVELLDLEGFDAEETDDRIEMRRCPFYGVAEGAPQVICTLHRGIIDGALDASGSARAVARLAPFVEPSLCIAHLTSDPSARHPVQALPRRACPAPSAR